MVQRLLCAVLASPPQTTGVRTRNALARAAGLINCDAVDVVNLLEVPTADTNAIAEAGREGATWKRSRSAISDGFHRADALLLAWGVSEPTGPARHHRREQMAWTLAEAQRAGHTRVWTVGDQPRHPSRWHQYVADRHGRTPRALTFEERLRLVLLEQDCGALLWSGASHCVV